jgi:hypothetical protein
MRRRNFWSSSPPLYNEDYNGHRLMEIRTHGRAKPGRVPRERAEWSSTSSWKGRSERTPANAGVVMTNLRKATQMLYLCSP